MTKRKDRWEKSLNCAYVCPSCGYACVNSVRAGNEKWEMIEHTHVLTCSYTAGTPPTLTGPTLAAGSSSVCLYGGVT